MGKDIINYVILIGTIIPMCFSKMYTFSLGNNEKEKQYAPFYLNGIVSLGGDTQLEIQFALSFFSPAIGFYSGTYPFDYSVKSGTSSLLNFYQILSLEFADEGKKGEGTLKLKGDKEVSIDDITGFITDNSRIDWEDAINSLGLAYSVGNNVNSIGFEKSEGTLELFKNSLGIKKIFSINQWEKTKYQNKPKFSSTLYLGEEHSDFSNKTNIGSCSIDTNSPFWNCQFSQMTINNKNISLINEKTEQPYEIRFIIESQRIVFPKSFKNSILGTYSLTGSKCYDYTTKRNTDLVLCEQMTEDDSETIPITFINAENTMKIRGEIDNENLLSNLDETITTAFPTNIYFNDTDYIIMPLTVFKKFHVLFDAENNKISFFTEDKSLLKLIQNKEEEKENNNKEDNLSYFKNHIFTTILIIAIVFLVIGLMVSICCSGKNAPTSIKIEGPVTEDE